MGPAGLTAVFGMGTGVTPPVWSPENRPAGGQATPAAIFQWSVTGRIKDDKCMDSIITTPEQVARLLEQQSNPLTSGICQHIPCHSDRIGDESTAIAWLALCLRGGEPIGVVKLLGC